MDDLEAILQDISEMEQAIRTLKERLSEIPAQIATQLSSDDERVVAARYLYWMVPELPSTAISESLLGVGTYDLKRYVSPATAPIPCDRCQQASHSVP